MQILIVEDNENKLSKIRTFFNERYSACDIEEAHSFNSGRRKVFEKNWDLVILDMSLPTYDITHSESGGDKKPIAGKNIIKRMKNRNVIIPTIIITQFETFDDEKISLDTLNREFQESFQDIWKGTIYYGNDDWESELTKLLDSIQK